MKSIEISKKELKDLYEKEKLTIPEISKFYNCSTSKIWANLWKYNITPSRAKKVLISRRDLEKLYFKGKLSTRKIAKRYNCGKSTIESKLRKCGVVLRNKSEALKLIPRAEKYIISKEKLKKLYEDKKLSTYKIAKIYNCSPSAIFHKLRKFNVPRRTDVEGIILTNNERCRAIAKAVSRYPKYDFNGTETERAYLIGFRLGDLYATKRRYGETVYLSSYSTKRAQIILMRDLFKRFGHILVRKRKKNTKKGEKDNYSFMAHLNSSFDFLVDKKDRIERWILGKADYFLSFLAGYIDAEGSFGIYNGFGSFTVGSYDKNIINQIHNKLRCFGIKTETPRVMFKRGYIDRRGIRTLKDLWSFRIRRKNELHNFINLIEPYIRHLKRKKDLVRAKNNVASRL